MLKFDRDKGAQLCVRIKFELRAHLCVRFMQGITCTVQTQTRNKIKNENKVFSELTEIVYVQRADATSYTTFSKYLIDIYKMKNNNQLDKALDVQLHDAQLPVSSAKLKINLYD